VGVTQLNNHLQGGVVYSATGAVQCVALAAQRVCCALLSVLCCHVLLGTNLYAVAAPRARPEPEAAAHSSTASVSQSAAVKATAAGCDVS
jgi:hypothetical protein